MRILTKQQVLSLHQMLIEQSGGSPEIRDDGLLESALNAPFQSFGDTDLYPSLLEKAARLGYGLLRIIHLWMGTRESAHMPCSLFLISTMLNLPIPIKN